MVSLATIADTLVPAESVLTMQVEWDCPLIVPDGEAPMHSIVLPSRITIPGLPSPIFSTMRLPGSIINLIPYDLVTPILSVDVITSVYPDSRITTPDLFGPIAASASAIWAYLPVPLPTYKTPFGGVPAPPWACARRLITANNMNRIA